MKRIIYQSGSGIAIIAPVDSCITIDEIARKDVPVGLPYRIINTSDIPTDRTFRDAWEADFSEPDGYGIGHESWCAAQKAKQEEAE